MRLALLAVLLLACAASAGPNAELLGRLREGGFVLYLRHTSTDFSQNDARMQSYEDCAHQRNLTDRGREEARVLGEHVKRLKIPIGEVLASPFCRTMETARLAFGERYPRKTCAADRSKLRATSRSESSSHRRCRAAQIA